MGEIVLQVDNYEYTGWTEALITKSLTSIAGTFSFTVTDKFPTKPENWDIKMGDPCTVFYKEKNRDNQVMITGYIEDMHNKYTKEHHEFTIKGRDKTGDLVDCSFIESVNSWKEQTILFVISALCLPFNISVVAHESVEDVVNNKITFKVDEGSTVLEMISKICRSVAILPVSYGDGNLTLTRAPIVGGQVINPWTISNVITNDAIESGVNVLTGALLQSNKERYSHYWVKAQTSGMPPWITELIENMDFAAMSSSEGEKGRQDSSNYGFELDTPIVEDKLIQRYRPVVILSDIPTSDGGCRKRAYWEMRVRAGQSRVLSYSVQDWVQSNGILWPLNALARIKDRQFGIDNQLLISELTFVVNRGGTKTMMTLLDPTTFELIEEPLEKMGMWSDFGEKLIAAWGPKDPIKDKGTVRK
ncbi:MAG: phage baseplate assembly protein [Candidatus Scalindua sp.]